MSTHIPLEQLSAFLNEELAGQEHTTVRQHVEACARCRRELKALDVTVAALRDMPRISEPGDMLGVLHARLHERRPWYQKTAEWLLTPSRLVWNGLGTAAAILLILVVVNKQGQLGSQPPVMPPESDMRRLTISRMPPPAASPSPVRRAEKKSGAVKAPVGLANAHEPIETEVLAKEKDNHVREREDDSLSAMMIFKETMTASKDVKTFGGGHQDKSAPSAAQLGIQGYTMAEGRPSGSSSSPPPSDHWGESSRLKGIGAVMSDQTVIWDVLDIDMAQQFLQARQLQSPLQTQTVSHGKAKDSAMSGEASDDELLKQDLAIPSQQKQAAQMSKPAMAGSDAAKAQWPMVMTLEVAMDQLESVLRELRLLGEVRVLDSRGESAAEAETKTQSAPGAVAGQVESGAMDRSQSARDEGAFRRLSRSGAAKAEAPAQQMVRLRIMLRPSQAIQKSRGK